MPFELYAPSEVLLGRFGMPMASNRFDAADINDEFILKIVAFLSQRKCINDQ